MKTKALSRDAIESLTAKMEKVADMQERRPNLSAEEVRVIQSLLAVYKKRLRPVRLTLSHYLREVFAAKDAKPMSPREVAKIVLGMGWHPLRKNAKAVLDSKSTAIPMTSSHRRRRRGDRLKTRSGT